MTTSRTAYKVDTNDRGSEDELLWAATWLYEATNDQTHLNYVSTNAVAFGGTGWAVKEFYWDNKYAGLQVLLTKVLLQAGSAPYSSVLKQYQAKAEFFICACLQKNTDHDVTMSPGGLLYFDDWNNMQYDSSAGFLLAVYSDYLSASKSNLKCPDGEIQPLDILRFAQSQVDYILGKNPKSISYLVGYGGSSPTHVHHRGASMPSIFAHPAPIGCIEGFENWYNNKNTDPNVILGALLGGPDDKYGFSDDRKSYKQTEPTLTGNAPLIGLLARLSCLPDSGR